MKKLALFFGIALLVAAVSPFIYITLQRHAFENALTERITRQVTGDKVTLNLKTVANDFEWDRLFVFTPYTSIVDIEQTIGTRWAGSRDIESSDAITLLVFVKKDIIVKYAELSRQIDFIVPDTSRGWSPDQANLELNRDGKRIVAKVLPETLHSVRHGEYTLEFVDASEQTAKWAWDFGKERVETSFYRKMRHGTERGYDESGALIHEGKWYGDKPWSGWCYVLLAGDAGSWGGIRHWKHFQNGKEI